MQLDIDVMCNKFRPHIAGTWLNFSIPRNKYTNPAKSILKAIKGTPYQNKGRVVLKGDAIIIDNRR